MSKHRLHFYLLLMLVIGLFACGQEERHDKRTFYEDTTAQTIVSQHPDLQSMTYDHIALVDEDLIVYSDVDREQSCELEKGSILFLESKGQESELELKFSYLKAVILKNGNLLKSCRLSPVIIDPAKVTFKDENQLRIESVPELVEKPAIDIETGLARYLKLGVWGIDARIVYPGERSDLLFQQNEEKKMRPASVTKVVTAFAACEEISDYCTASSNRYSRIKDAMKRSDNSIFSSIHKGLGGSGKVVETLEAAGVNRADQYKFIDGSGLSYNNSLSVQSLSDVLVIANQRDYRSEFKEIFAKPGEKGTLKNRLKNFSYPLYGKTGTLTNGRTAALAGYVELPRKAVMVFSIIANDVNATTGHANINEILQILSDHAAYRVSNQLPSS